MCLIADSAPQIHSAVRSVYPECHHVYCGFHLLKGKTLLGCTKGLNKKERELVMGRVRKMFVSYSMGGSREFDQTVVRIRVYPRREILAKKGLNEAHTSWP